MSGHRYEARTSWTGSTGLGWERYDRAHDAVAPPAEQRLRLTTGEPQGDPRMLNPEQLVVMAASSCQLLWFLHLAAKARIDVVEYEDRASGEMPEDFRLGAARPPNERFAGGRPPANRITRIELRPRIVVRGEASDER